MVARLLRFTEGGLPVQTCAPDFSLTLSGHGYVMQQCYDAGMCIGIPMQVAELDGAFAWCEGRGRRERLNTMLLEELSPGDWVYATLGQAREILNPQRADEINLALDGLAAALQGETNLDSYFPSNSASAMPLEPEKIS